MECREYERYFFLEKEWKLLLAGLGIEKWYGLDGGESEEKPDKPANHAVLAGLYQKNIIDWDGQGVRMKPPFSKIFAALKDSVHCITIDRKNREFPVQCCYVGPNGIVMTEKSQREKNTLCVSFLSKGEFIQFILEYLSKYSEGIFTVSETEECAGGQEKFLLKLQDCRSGGQIETLMLYEKGLQTYLMVENKKETIRFPYVRNRLRDYLQKWVHLS